jgi:hypothetical protein
MYLDPGFSADRSVFAEQNGQKSLGPESVSRANPSPSAKSLRKIVDSAAGVEAG